MAVYTRKRIRVTDADGNPISGGKVRLYDENTTDLADVYSDAGLTVSLTNPVVADANGWAPVIFGADGLTVDVAYLDADDNEISGTSEESVTFVGSDSGDFTRTVSGNGRIKITGSAGAVQLQVGDPDPDDTGGSLTIGGWSGTQGDTLSLDFSTVNVTGELTVGGKALLGVVYTAETSFSAASSVDITLPEVPDNARAYRIIIYDLVFSASGQPRIRLGYGGAVKSGASDYAYRCLYYNSTSGVFGPGESAGTDNAVLHGQSVPIVANKPARVVLEVTTPDSGNDATTVLSRYEGYSDEVTDLPTVATGVIYGLGSYGRCDTVRFYSTAGTVTGKYKVEVLYGFGE